MANSSVSLKFMNTKMFLGLNHFLPRRWRWEIKRILRLNQGLIHPQLDHIDFFSGSNIIFDVGANRGNFATSILLRAPLSQVHGFEPNPEIFPVFEEVSNNVGKNNGKPRIIANQYGVGSAPAQTEFIINKAHYTSSFLPVSEDVVKGFPDTDFSETRRVPVKVITLEKYAVEHQIKNAKLLKIDVQGYELEVLKGCGEFLDRIEYVFVEVEFKTLYVGSPSWHSIVSFLYKRGFHPVTMAGFCLSPDGELLQGDLLFKGSRSYD